MLILAYLIVAAMKVSRGAGEAFTALYQEFLPKVFRYVSYRIPDTHLAEDLTATTFEKALTKFDTYSSEKGAFSTWIFSIARNTVYDHFRVRKQALTVPLDDEDAVADGSASPEEKAVRADEIKRLHTCLGQLASNEQEIISLKFGAEMTNRQIARMLGLSESNVGVILFRAVKKLRTEFQG